MTGPKNIEEKKQNKNAKRKRWAEIMSECSSVEEFSDQPRNTLKVTLREMIETKIKEKGGTS